MGISVARIRSTFKDGFVIGLVLAGVGYAVASFTLPSGWRFFPQLLFNEGTTVLLVILIIAGIAGKFKGNRGLAGLIAGVIICFYLAGGISIMANG